MLKATYTLIISGCLLFLFSCNSSNNKDPLKLSKDENKEKVGEDKLQNDLDFIVEAASDCLMQVALGQMAQQKGSSPKVKEFGVNMETDHSKVLAILKDLAARKNISIPAETSEKHGKRLEKLSKLAGSEFDKKYIEFMIEDHEEELGHYHKIATEGKDPETKAFAAGQLEVLKLHLDMAKATENILQ